MACESEILPHLIGKNYEVSLKNSLQAFFDSRQILNSITSSSFTSKFQELMRAKTDPPLDVIWVSTFLSFNDLRAAPKNESLSSILVIKELFQLIVSHSASCGHVKSIILVAPVLYKLHCFIRTARTSSLGPSKDRKVNREVQNLLDSVLGYINVCCEGFDRYIDHSDGLIRPIDDFISLWIVDNLVGNQNKETLKAFFPFLSNDVITRVNTEGCGLTDLAGFVMGEAILLKLCWKIHQDGFGEKMKNSLKTMLVGSITGLHNSYLYVTLMKMLLDPVLPVTSLMNPEYENGVKEVLFGALLLVEYSFLSPEMLGKLPVKHAKCLMFAKLMATHESIEFFRGLGDQFKAIPFLNAFAYSSLPTQIIKWVGKDTGNNISTDCPGGSSPTAFLRWILDIENRGIKIFDDELSKHLVKLMLEKSKQELEQCAIQEDVTKQNSDLFYFDKEGNEENGSDCDDTISKSTSAAFVAAAHKIQSCEQGVKTQKVKAGEKRKRVKFERLNLTQNYSLSGKQSRNPTKDDSYSGSEIENPSSDDDEVTRE